jgi:hypothetical protein
VIQLLWFEGENKQVAPMELDVNYPFNLKAACLYEANMINSTNNSLKKICDYNTIKLFNDKLLN